MEQEIEVMEPQKKPEEQEGIEELKKKAEVSSQNFERAKKAESEVKELRAKLKEIEQLPTIDDVFSDEGKLLSKEIDTLREQISSMQIEQTRGELESLYPVLKDKKEEFEEFLQDEENKNIPLGKVAKLFLLDKGLLETNMQERQGLERPTGGQRGDPEKQGISSEEIKDLRVNHPKKYAQMLREGKLKPEDIKG